MGGQQIPGGVVHKLPADLRTALAGNADALAAWKDITPPQLTSWSKVSIIDAGHFDEETAYVAVNRFRLDDLRPHVYRTHDGGKTWTEIVKGLPDDPVNARRGVPNGFEVFSPPDGIVRQYPNEVTQTQLLSHNIRSLALGASVSTR